MEMRSETDIAVLHVDDMPSFAEMAATIVEREDDRITVATASNASEGLDYLTENRVDCIVSDYEMPGSNGIEFLEIVREKYPDLPFILFTGRGSEEVASDAIAAGVTGYLQKERGTSQYAVLANRIVNAVEQYRAERRVDETEQRYRRLIEESTDVITVVDEAGTFTYLSPAAERVLGYAASEFVGENAFEYIHRDDRDSAIARFTDVIEHPERRVTDEFRFEHAAEGWRWLEARGRNLLDDPAIDGIVVYARNVTGRVEAECER